MNEHVFRLFSSEFEPHGSLSRVHELNSFGGQGENLSPHLQWSEPPAGTRSFALTLYDPAAPTGSGFWHWLVVNLPADLRELPANAAPLVGAGKLAGAMHLRNDFGVPDYAGPCPPEGDAAHPYRFTLHALDVEDLDLAPETTNALARFMINGRTIAAAELLGHYRR